MGTDMRGFKDEAFMFQFMRIVGVKGGEVRSV